MKAVLLLLFCGLVCISQVFCVSPVGPNGQIFGVPIGSYKGSGVLNSTVWYFPDLEFTSFRNMTNNAIISVETRAYLLGLKVADITADLQIHPQGQNFFITLANNSMNQVGKGSCSFSSCTFTATVAHGELTLTETWVPISGGFQVVNSSQVYQDRGATYGPVTFIRW